MEKGNRFFTKLFFFFSMKIVGVTGFGGLWALKSAWHPAETNLRFGRSSGICMPSPIVFLKISFFVHKIPRSRVAISLLCKFLKTGYAKSTKWSEINSEEDFLCENTCKVDYCSSSPKEYNLTNREFIELEDHSTQEWPFTYKQWYS